MAETPAARPNPFPPIGSFNKNSSLTIPLRDPYADAVQKKKTLAELKQLPKDLATSKTKLANARKEVQKQADLRWSTAEASAADPTNAAKKTAYNNALLAYDAATKASLKYAVEVTNLESKITSAKTWLDQNNVQYAVQSGASSSSNQTSNSTVTNAGDFKRKTYVYNIPLIKYAHFNAPGSDHKSISLRQTAGEHLMPLKVKDGLAAFNNNGNSKGIIQMSAETAYYLSTEEGKKGYKGKKTVPYGFKFHYNPNSISMSYGTMVDMSPELLMSGRDKINPIMPPGTGGFSFELMINRLEDLNYINPDGTLKPVKEGDTVVLADRAKELYGTAEPTEYTFKEIWNKGTMYDIEFLFKALHGGKGDYMSSLRGKSSDQGWLNGAAVEFHLGSNLRYLGRIVSVDITHGMFNSRMVPLISYVTIKAARFYDLKTTKDPRTVPATSVSGVKRAGGTPRGAVFE